MKFFYIIFILFLFTACAPKIEIKKSESYAVAIKMKKIAFSDAGFLKYGKDYTELQLFDASNIVLDLIIKDDICINSHCFSKRDFNAKFLSEKYPENFLNDILNKKAIFNKIGYKVTKNGFMQNIEKKNLRIKYFVSNDKLYFKDFSNHILIKLKRIDE